MHTFAIENEPQYLGLSLENAEFSAPLFFFSISGAEVPGGESVN